MENSEEQEDQFEDFTTASEWESFTAALEHVLIEWQTKPVVDSDSIHHGWIIWHEKVSFADFPFKFSYFKKLIDCGSQPSSAESIVTSSNAFPPYLLGASSKESELFPPKFTPHKISDYFDVQEFAVLTSAGVEPLQNESKLKVLKSSACMALNSTNSCFPIFIQYHHWNQQFYDGIAEYNGTRTSFPMVHLKNAPVQHRYLGGLLSIFKSKLSPTLTSPVGVTVHFFYKMQSWHTKYTFDSFPPELFEELQRHLGSADEVDEENKDATSLPLCSRCYTNFLPFGSLDDPFLELEFVAGWPFLTEEVVVDSPTYSDLDPANAPEWHFSLRPHMQAEFRLHEMLDVFWKLQNDNRSVEEVLGKKLDQDESDVQYVSALERLALANSPLPVPINRVISNVNKAHKQLLFSPAQYTDLAPLAQEQLDAILQFLFPDASRSTRYAYPALFEFTPGFKKESCISAVDTLQGSKSAPVGSLIWRLAIVISYLNSYVGSASAVAHLWAEIVLELRYRWENSMEIPGLERGAPNSGTCLLNQKLQMLNCCINKKIQREKNENDGKQHFEKPEVSGEESEDEDEFFDCDDSLPERSNAKVDVLKKPVGRLRKCGRLRLLKTGEPMYIPVTQDPAPLTEDVVEEQAKQLVELGNDAEGSEQRAKMMSASLMSDMESFKAANPGALLEDFVRWYSPRDWIELDELDEFGNKAGTLSPRMNVPGNLWLEVWSNALPVPARRQKRLFDDTREAEKILSWMRCRTLHDVCQLMYPCLIHAAVLKVVEEVENFKMDYSLPVQLIQHTPQLTRAIRPEAPQNSTFADHSYQGDTSDGSSNTYFLAVLSLVRKVEKDLTQIRSFQQKFPQIDMKTLVSKRGENSDDNGNNGSEPELVPEYIKVEGGAKSPVGETIKDIFRLEATRNTESVEGDYDFKFGEPVRKVFVLKYTPGKSNNGSTGSMQFNQEETLPQRMSCLIKNDEFLLAGTFTARTDVS